MFGFGPDMIYGIPGLLSAITFHVYAQAKVADNLGDPTPRYNGRVTLNPLAHIDPIGLILLFIAKIGWAKPVPVNPIFFNNPRKNELEVSLSGPIANLILGFICYLAIPICFHFNLGTLPVIKCLNLAALYNVYFAIFNLIPIPPLVGSKILALIFPTKFSAWIENYTLNRYNYLIFVALMFLGVFNWIIQPIAIVIFKFYMLIGNLITGIMF